MNEQRFAGLAAIAAVLLAGNAPATAGPGKPSSGALGQVTEGIADRTSSSDSSGGADSSRSPEVRDHRDDSRHDDDDDDHDLFDDPATGAGYFVAATPCYSCGDATGTPGRAAPRVGVSFELGVQSVHNSDGAGFASLRLHSNRFGITARGTSYFERPANGGELIRMDVWDLMLSGQLVAGERTALWLSGGITGLRSTAFERLMGPSGALELTHQVTPSLGGYGGARVLGLEKGIRAYELRGGLRAAFFTLGYRVLDFNEGPPLHGPEFGVAFGF